MIPNMLKTAVKTGRKPLAPSFYYAKKENWLNACRKCKAYLPPTEKHEERKMGELPKEITIKIPIYCLRCEDFLKIKNQACGLCYSETNEHLKEYPDCGHDCHKK